MLQRTNPRELGLARLHLEGLNAHLIAAAGARRQGISPANDGARAPASLARAPVTLEVLVEPLEFVCEAEVPIGSRLGVRPRVPAKARQITPFGFKTARRRVPIALERLGLHDERYLAAMVYADACERLGSVAGMDLAGASGGGGASDGGATSGVQTVRIVARAHAAINGWSWDARAHRATCAQKPLLMLAPRKLPENRRSITALALFDGVLLNSQSARQILEAHGWSRQSHLATRLNGLFVALLGEIVGPLAEEKRAR